MGRMIDYASKFDLQNLVDEKFKLEAKSNKVVNQDFDFVGAKTVKLYTVSTANLVDYQRTGTNRFGTPEDLSATVQEMTLTQDKAFSFVIDKLDEDETKGALQAATALERQLREVVIPEIDKYRFDTIAANAATIKEEVLTVENIYGAILAAQDALNDAEVPFNGRQIIVTSKVVSLIKQSKEIYMETDIAQEARNRGVVGLVDGLEVVMIPASRIGVEDFGFMITHPVAATGPVKLAEYRIHTDPPGISGSLVEGRISHDCFVLDNKEDAIYLHLDKAQG